MEFLQQIVDNSDIPVLTAFILGLMTAISPCPLATNITATAYLSKDIADKKRVLFNGIFYTLGRTFSYTALGLVFYFGASKFYVAKMLQNISGLYLGIALIIIGILMLDVIKFNIPALSKITSKVSEKRMKKNYLNAFLLGVLFALAFLSIQWGTLFRCAYSYDN
jgi:cytochrome c-type biogenesis protein